MIEAGDTVKVIDIRSPFYEYEGKVIEETIDQVQPGSSYYKVDLGITVIRDPSHYERLVLTFILYQLKVIATHV